MIISVCMFLYRLSWSGINLVPVSSSFNFTRLGRRGPNRECSISDIGNHVGRYEEQRKLQNQAQSRSIVVEIVAYRLTYEVPTLGIFWWSHWGLSRVFLGLSNPS